MLGTFQHTLDSKGRLSVPAKYREEYGNVFFITISPYGKFLDMYSEDSWQAFCDKINALPYAKQRKMRPLFSKAAKCELDAQGRVLLNQILREYAGLTKNVSIIGSNDHAEIWDSERWSEVDMEESKLENMELLIEEFNLI